MEFIGDVITWQSYIAQLNGDRGLWQQRVMWGKSLLDVEFCGDRNLYSDRELYGDRVLWRLRPRLRPVWGQSHRELYCHRGRVTCIMNERCVGCQAQVSLLLLISTASPSQLCNQVRFRHSCITCVHTCCKKQYHKVLRHYNSLYLSSNDLWCAQ